MNTQSSITQVALFTALTSISAAQTWTAAHPEAPDVRRSYAGAVAQQGGVNQIFQFGGKDELGDYENGTWRFSHTAGWTVLGDMPANRAKCCAATAQVGGVDRVFLFGGTAAEGSATTTNWAYDPATDSWDTAPSGMPHPRNFCEAVTAPNGKIYVFGGQNGTGMVRYDSTFEYDPNLDTWSILAPMPRKRTHFAAVADCDGYIYLHGGQDAPTTWGAVDCFNTNTNTWLANNPHTETPFEPMWTPRAHLAGALGRNGKQYLLGGGISAATSTSTVEAYDPYANEWSSEPSMLQDRMSFRAHGMGSRIWAMDADRKPFIATKHVESFGGLSVESACADNVPGLPIHFPGHTFASAGPLVFATTLPGIAIGNFESAFFELATAPDGQIGFGVELESNAPLGSLSVGLYDANGQLIAERTGNDLFTPKMPYPHTSVFVVVRDLAGQQGGTEFDLTVTSTDNDLPLGGTYASPAVPNSSGEAAAIEATGSDGLAHNQLQLHIDGLPANQFGFCLVSRTEGFIQHPGGSAGNLVVTGDIGRYSGNVLSSGNIGEAWMDVDLTDLPTNPSSAAIAGESYHFTYWFRDVMQGQATSNFSDGVRVEFK